MRGVGPYLCFIKIFYILAAAMYTMLLHFTFFINLVDVLQEEAVTAILEIEKISKVIVLLAGGGNAGTR
jgi:hypothetical protein